MPYYRGLDSYLLLFWEFFIITISIMGLTTLF